MNDANEIRDTYKKFNEIKWVGMTQDETKEKFKEIFGDSLWCMFVNEFRITELYYPTLVTFKVVDNKVVDSRWH